MDKNAKDIQPSIYKKSFKCPRCKANTQHVHFRVDGEINQRYNVYRADINKIIDPSKYVDEGDNQANIEIKDWDLYITVCTVCNQYTIWENEIIIFPFESSIAEPSPDMPKEMKDIYEEARQVYKFSPRASAALLRLAIETLIPLLDYGIKKENNNLNKMIGELVNKGIPDHIQQGLDIIRYYGNDSIHTAEINLEERKGNVLFLFKFCNMIVDELITKDKEIKSLYELIPDGVINGIEKRDNT